MRNNFEIKSEFTKYLKDSYWLGFCEHVLIEYLQIFEGLTVYLIASFEAWNSHPPPTPLQESSASVRL